MTTPVRTTVFGQHNAWAKNRKDFTGVRRGELVAVRVAHWTGTGMTWFWKCDRCGSETTEAAPSKLANYERWIRSGRMKGPLCCNECRAKAMAFP